jgi:hypothetical protein
MKNWIASWRTNMPASSEKQKKFMDAAAHNPKFAKAAGVPQNVAKDFSEKSKGLKFGKGQETRADVQKVNEPKTLHGQDSLFKKGGKTMAKFDPKSLFKGKESMGEELKEAKAIKSGKISPMQYAKGEKSEPMKKMAKGGISTSLKAHAAAPASKAHAGMAKGGGVESKGKTKGKMVTMKRGGKC